MIGRLTGNIVERDLQRLLLDVGGVGYEVQIPLSTSYKLAELSNPVTIFTHLVVRDDAHLLFGFASQEERELFRVLIKVNTVGPRVALGILSGLDAESFARSVRNEDIKTLVSLPGVGKKTAELLIIGVRDKLSALNLVDEVPVASAAPDITEDVEAALIELGYKPQAAARAIARVAAASGTDPAGGVEVLIRQALKELTTGQG